MKELLKNWRIIVLIVCITASLAIVFINGLSYGLDFAGGVGIHLQLETPVSPEVMAVEKRTLENRLNSMGLKDIPVNPYGDQYILIKVPKATAEELEIIKNIIKQQARFEQMIDGKLVASGGEINIDLTPSGSGIYKVSGGYDWIVRVRYDKDAACRFGEVATGKKGRPVDMFIDRPQNTTILMPDGTYQLLKNLTVKNKGTPDYALFSGDAGIEIIENRSLIPVIALGDMNETLEKLETYRTRGYNRVILAGDEKEIPDEIRSMLEDINYTTQRMSKEDKSYGDWIRELTGLKNSPTLQFDPMGECQYDAQITGGASTLQEAENEIRDIKVLLTSGNLPVEAEISGETIVPATLGERFLFDATIAGVFAIIVVALVVFLRYKKLFIVMPLLMTGMSEILIILGIGSLLRQDIDLPAIAGIITAIGTGVDHQIVITDETLKKGRKKEIVSVTEQINRAFFIIFTAAATTIAAMLPLMSIGAGMLKGFALFTIIGVMVGVLVTRPAYARIIEFMLKK